MRGLGFAHWVRRRAGLGLLATVCIVRADVIELKNGSRLVGTLTSIAQSKVVVETSFAGALTIDQGEVLTLQTEDDRFVQLASGSTLLGQLRSVNEQVLVQTANGALDISKDSIVSLWQSGEASPHERELAAAAAAAERTWAYELAAGVTGKSGNTERIASSARFSATLKSQDDKLLFYAAGDRAEENHQTTSNELRGGVDYEYVYPSGHSWYVRNELEYDEIEGLDLRATAAGGYGYYLLRKPAHDLRGRLGLSYRYEGYADGTTESSPGLDVGLLHRWQLAEGTVLHNAVTYTPSFDDFGRFVVYHESSLEFDLATNRDLALRLGVEHQYTSQPLAGKDRLDTTYFARLVLKWK